MFCWYLAHDDPAAPETSMFCPSIVMTTPQLMLSPRCSVQALPATGLQWDWITNVDYEICHHLDGREYMLLGNQCNRGNPHSQKSLD
jgi:hypothetical protein